MGGIELGGDPVDVIAAGGRPRRHHREVMPGERHDTDPGAPLTSQRPAPVVARFDATPDRAGRLAPPHLTAEGRTRRPPSHLVAQMRTSERPSDQENTQALEE